MAPPTLTKTHTKTNPTRKPNWLRCCFGHGSSSNRVFERPIAIDEGGNGTDRDEISYKKVDESLDGGGDEGVVRKGRRRSKVKRYWSFCWPVVRNRAIMKKSGPSSSKAKHERSGNNSKLPWKWLGKGTNNDVKGGGVEVTKGNLEQVSSQPDNHRHRHVVPFAQVVVVERTTTTTSHIDHKSSSQTTRQWVNLGETGPQVRRQPNASNETTTTSTCHKVSSSAKKSTERRSKENPASREPDPSKPTGSHKSPAAKKPRAGRLQRDCILGASILLVTLMVMICCGRLCAILCTSVWLYCGPWLIRANRNVGSAEGDDEGSRLTSERYRRKKVVLDGFLDRSRKQSVDITLRS